MQMLEVELRRLPLSKFIATLLLGLLVGVSCDLQSRAMLAGAVRGIAPLADAGESDQLSRVPSCSLMPFVRNHDSRPNGKADRKEEALILGSVVEEPQYQETQLSLEAADAD